MFNPVKFYIRKFNILFFVFAILGMWLQLSLPAFAIQDSEIKESEPSIKSEKTNKKLKRVKLKKEEGYYQQEFGLDAKITEKPLINEINFDDVLKKAKSHSYDLKIADFDILISKTSVTNARSEYFPKLNIGVGTEYTKSFRDDGLSTVSIGDSFINPYTRFQSIIGLTLNYNLFDFGVRRGYLDIAKEDIILKSLIEAEQEQELTLNLIDSYSKILITKKQIQLYQEMLKIQKQNLDMSNRLFEAKEISKTELNDRVVGVVETEKNIEDLKKIMSESLTWLEFYTGEKYDLENLVISEMNIPKVNIDETVDYTKTITWKIYEKELKKKELELKVARRNYLPKVNAYGRYYIYGSDATSYGDSLGDIKPSTFTVGGSVNMALFDGLKNRSNVQKASFELRQMQVKRDKAIAQWLARLATLRSNFIYMSNEIECSERIIKELKDKDSSLLRLVSKKVISPIEQNDSKIKLIEQQIEYVNNKATNVAIMQGIAVLIKNEEISKDGK